MAEAVQAPDNGESNATGDVGIIRMFSTLIVRHRCSTFYLHERLLNVAGVLTTFASRISEEMNEIRLVNCRFLCLVVVALPGLAFPADMGLPAVPRTGGLRLENGWFVHHGRVVWGYAQHNGWWGGYRDGQGFWTTYKVRTNITRNAPSEVGPCLTENLGELTDNMLRHGYPAFEHNFGLWYDRRRDAHDTVPRADANVVSPFLEQPWARSRTGTAWDGSAKYDLTAYNAWYFNRLREFAEHCDRKGAILFHNFYMQHALLETNAHYVDFPWRPTNCIQRTEMPDSTPAADAFYNVSHPVRRELHRRYIRHCLDVLGRHKNVVHLLCQEYTGPIEFVQFWLDAISEWEKEKSINVLVGLGATKDVLDEILADPVRGAEVSVIDLRYWWYKADGSLFAPQGGRELPGRYAAGFEIAAQSSPEQIYHQVQEYRMRFREKGIIHAIDATREQTWAFLMGGGSMLIRRMEYPDSREPPPWKPPTTYIAPEDSAIVQPTYNFINDHLASLLPDMKPARLLLDHPDRNWCLAATDRAFLIYALRGGGFRMDLSEAKGAFRARWLNPRSGQLWDANGGTVEGGETVSFDSPDRNAWALWLIKKDVR